MTTPILYIASRPFLPASGGRETMILQSLQFLEAQHSVSVVVFKARGEAIEIERYYDRFPLFHFHVLDLPPVKQWMAAWMLSGRLLPLQVAMYLSRHAQREIGEILLAQQCQLVIADMLRTSLLFKWKMCASVLELDDLLSLRYERIMRAHTTDRPLGTFESRVPVALGAIVNACAPLFLGYERWAISRMENACPKRHKAVILVSQTEASAFRRRTGASNIYSIPPTTKVCAAPERTLPETGEPVRLMFLGNMRTGANRQALHYICDDVLPLMRQRGLAFQFHAIGHCPDEIIARHVSDDITFTGFIEDSRALMDTMHIHLAPMFGGTGIKTKILESLAQGMPTITTPDGAMGLDVESGKELFICESAADMVDRFAELSADPQLFSDMSTISAFYASDRFNFNSNRQRYLEIVNSCLTETVETSASVMGVAQ